MLHVLVGSLPILVCLSPFVFHRILTSKAKATGVIPEYYQYVRSVCGKEPSILQELRQASLKAFPKWCIMLSAMDQMQLFQILLRTMKAKVILNFSVDV